VLIVFYIVALKIFDRYHNVALSIRALIDTVRNDILFLIEICQIVVLVN